MEERSKMIAEILDLAKNPPLAGITAETFVGQGDHRVHGALMAMRAFDANGRMLLSDIIGTDMTVVPDPTTEEGVVDFSMADIAAAIGTRCSW